MLDFDYEIEDDPDYGSTDMPLSNDDNLRAYDTNPVSETTMIGQVDTSVCDASQISFTSHISDMYDREILRAEKDYAYNIREIAKADDIYDIKYHADEALDAAKSIDYWTHSKFDAEIEAQKSALSIEELSKQYDLIGKHEEEMRKIYNMEW